MRQKIQLIIDLIVIILMFIILLETRKSNKNTEEILIDKFHSDSLVTQILFNQAVITKKEVLKNQFDIIKTQEKVDSLQHIAATKLNDIYNNIIVNLDRVSKNRKQDEKKANEQRDYNTKAIQLDIDRSIDKYKEAIDSLKKK